MIRRGDSPADEEGECGGIFQRRRQTLSGLMVFKSAPQAGGTQSVSAAPTVTPRFTQHHHNKQKALAFTIKAQRWDNLWKASQSRALDSRSEVPLEDISPGVSECLIWHLKRITCFYSRLRAGGEGARTGNTHTHNRRTIVLQCKRNAQIIERWRRRQQSWLYVTSYVHVFTVEFLMKVCGRTLCVTITILSC